MMYHFIFGLRGCSPATPSGETGGMPLGAAASFLISSVIIVPTGMPAGTSLLAVEELEQVAQSKLDHGIDHIEECGKDKHGDDDHRGRRLNFFAARVVDFFHLGPDIVEEILRPFRPRLQPTAYVFFISHGCSLHSFCLNTSHLKPASLLPGKLPLPIKPLVLEPSVPSRITDGPVNWQGRRDSNPQVRFWRPAV